MTTSERKHTTSVADNIDRYLRDQLSAEELAEFEVSMLEDPALFEAVERAELMREAFKKHHQTSDKMDVVSDKQKQVSQVSFMQWIQQPLSMAASVVMMIAVGFSTLQWIHQPGSVTNPGATAGQAVNSVVTLAPTRSGGGETILPAGVHLIQVDVGITLDNPDFDVSVISQELGNEQYQFTLIPDSNGILRLLTAESWLGRYLLEVRQRNDNDSSVSAENVMTYALRFVEGNQNEY